MEDTVVMFRIKKGHHGYIKRKKRLLLGEVLGLLIGIIGLVVIGVVTTGSRKNLLTVVAMVSVIPMVNQLVILIALWKYQPCPDKEYEQVASLVGKGILDTELVITSKTDKSFLIDYACIHEKGVFCYCSDKKCFLHCPYLRWLPEKPSFVFPSSPERFYSSM